MELYPLYELGDDADLLALTAEGVIQIDLYKRQITANTNTTKTIIRAFFLLRFVAAFLACSCSLSG